MLSVYRTLSVRYLGRRWFRAVLIVLSIALGVATLVATRALNDTMTKVGLETVNPFAGVADLVVSNGESPIGKNLAQVIEKVPGVQAANPSIFKTAKLPDYKQRQVLVIGLDLWQEFNEKKRPALKITLSEETDAQYKVAEAAYRTAGRFFTMPIPVIVGEELDDFITGKGVIPIEENKLFHVKVERANKISKLVRVGKISGAGPAAVLGGNVLILDLYHAANVLGMKQDQVSRIDVVLAKDSNLETVRKAVEEAVKGQGTVRTPEEQDLAMGNVMSGMQAGFALCGLAALVVGLFLVYNALAVCVAERRHEIGVLLSVGATRRQIVLLFAGEALLLGLAGSLVGIPLGIALANLGLDQAQQILSEVFTKVETRQVEVSLPLLLLALAAGIGTAVAAALVPAIMASYEIPAEAVRRIQKTPTWRSLTAQIVISVILLLSGLMLMVLRREVPYRFGVFGGLVLVLLAALVATPLVTALGARLIQPLVRVCFRLEWRLAVDNLIRSPGRTGLVVAALAAGVALVLQTFGTLRSNRYALRAWVQDFLSADLVITSGTPVASDQSMTEELGRHIQGLPAIAAVLPTRYWNVDYGDTQIRLNAVDAPRMYAVDRQRRPQARDLLLYQQLSEPKEHGFAVIVSDNFAARYGKDKGDTFTLNSPKGEIRLHILGTIPDFSWSHGSVLMNRRDFLEIWGDRNVNWYDVYLKPGADVAAAQAVITQQFAEHHGLKVQTRHEVQKDIDDMIDRLYSIALAQQIVVVFVAVLGVVTALLISVLQRRREMGLLRAIGASRVQGIRSVLAEAALMGIFGSIIGILVGIPLQWYVLKVLIFEESGYVFPLHIPWLEALVIAAAAMLAAILAGLGPALHAVRQRIPEAIAYE